MNAIEAGTLLRILKPLVTQSWQNRKLAVTHHPRSMWDGPICGVVENGASTIARFVYVCATPLVITCKDDHVEVVNRLVEDHPLRCDDPLEPRCQACSRRRADRSCRYCGMNLCYRCIIMGRSCRCSTTHAVAAPFAPTILTTVGAENGSDESLRIMLGYHKAREATCMTMMDEVINKCRQLWQGCGVPLLRWITSSRLNLDESFSVWIGNKCPRGSDGGRGCACSGPG